MPNITVDMPDTLIERLTQMLHWSDEQLSRESVERTIREAITVLSETPRVPAGWKLVPKEPTPEMLAIYKQWQRDGRAYLDISCLREVIAAAPEAP